MEKYIRRIVQLKSIQGDKRMSDKSTTSYYKFEKRNDRYKIALSVEGLSPNTEENYVFCIVLKKDHQYSIKQLRTLLVKGSHLNETIPIGETDGLFVVGAIIARKRQQKPLDYLKDVVLIGCHEEEFSLSDLEVKQSAYLNDSSDDINDNPSINSKEQTEKNDTSNDESPGKKIAIGDQEEQINQENGKDQEEQIGRDSQKDQEEQISLEGQKDIDIEQNYKNNEDQNDHNPKEKAPNESVKNCSSSEKFHESTENKDNEYYHDTRPEGHNKASQSPLGAKNIEDKNKVREEENNELKNSLNGAKRKRDQNSRFETFDTIKKQMEKPEIEGIIQELFEKNQKMQPFENDDINAEWIKIDITDLVFLPIESWMYINNAFLMNCYRKYKHLLLGRKKGQGFIILGVPDIYFFKTSIVANLCGFFEFTSYKNALPKAGDYGYWLVKTNV